MPISHGDQLFRLIESLTKAEKRNFRLYAKKIQGEGDVKFLQLFDLLEKQKEFDEDAVLLKMKGNKTQFSNIKRHLYQHILTSLRLMEIYKSEEIQVREWIDYASILYGRGLYIHSLKLLSKSKSLAEKINHDILLLEIVEFEKRIESRHITRSSTERMEGLTEEAKKHSNTSLNNAILSNLKLMLQREFINKGHVKDEAGLRKLDVYLRQISIDEHQPHLTFFEKVYLYQVYFWYYYLLLDYEKCKEYALKWVAEYDNEPKMIDMDVDIYMIGLHHLLSTTFFLRDYSLFSKTLGQLEKFRKDSYRQFNSNSRIMSFLFVHQGRFNQYFLSGDFQEGVIKIIPHTLNRLTKFENKLDTHKVLVMYFKIAWMYMGAGKQDQAIDYLNRILNHSERALREDIQAYASLLFIMAHFDLKNYDLLEYLVTNTSRFINRMRDASQLQKSSIRFFRQLVNTPPDDYIKRFLKFRDQLAALKLEPYEKRSFVFLDIESWIESKIQQKTLQLVVKERFLRRMELALENEARD
jgi:hypothetical protein